MEILQPGYRIGDRILRPARVAVAEPDPNAPAPAAEAVGEVAEGAIRPEPERKCALSRSTSPGRRLPKRPQPAHDPMRQMSPLATTINRELIRNVCRARS